MFYMDKYMPSPAQLELVLVITVAVIIVFAIIWCTIFGQHPERHRHMRAIMRGRRHRHLTKTTMWHMKQERAREWIGIFANMHTSGNVGALLVDAHKHLACLVTQALADRKSVV